jgi:hypothetical protein
MNFDQSRFSKPQNFNSYIQSKGRARHANSNYYILVENEEANDFEKELNNFIEIENVTRNQIFFIKKKIKIIFYCLYELGHRRKV